MTRAWAVVVLLLAGCATQPLSNEGAVEACVDFYLVSMDLCECDGVAPQASCATIILGKPGRTCHDVRSIRDLSSFVGDCIPKLAGTTCEHFTTGGAGYVPPATCRDQLIF